MSVRIITDSTCDITVENAKEMDVELIPLKVNFGKDEYIDKFTITNADFYEKLKTCEELPTTTLVNHQTFFEAFKKYPDDDIVVILVSQKLSGTFQSAVMAKQESGRDNIYLVDSDIATIGAALLVYEAVRYRDEGVGAKELAEKLEAMKSKVRLFAVIDTLKYLQKGGRISAAQAVMGNALGIKPLITVSRGEVQTIGKARGIKKAIAEILEKIAQNPIDKTLPVIFAYTDTKDHLPALMDKVTGVEGKIISIGSVVGTYAGTGAVAIAYFAK